MTSYLRRFNMWYDTKLKEPYRLFLFLGMILIPIILVNFGQTLVQILIGFMLFICMLLLRVVKW